MQVYTQDDELIERWQWNDPALRNLSDVVMSLLEGQSGRVLDLGCGSVAVGGGTCQTQL
jgi:predicted TPR repeat methyltransferase